MSTTFDRFPTTTPDRVPILPDHEVFEEVKTDLGLPIEEVMAREPWSFEKADDRAMHAMLDAGWQPGPVAMVPPEDPVVTLTPPREPKQRPQCPYMECSLKSVHPHTEGNGMQVKYRPRDEPKDRTKKGPTPKRKTSEMRFQRGSEGGCYS